MNVPRWTVYPAVGILATLLITAIPGEVEEPYSGAARTLRVGPSAPAPTTYPRVVVLGIDGMDPDILEDVIALYPAQVPNLRKLVESGSGIHSLGTSTPPQSPVAWSNFITGMDPGGHGIFDFIHRDLVTRMPASSTVRAGDDPTMLPLGSYRIPLPIGDAGGSNRTGQAFWTTLRDHGVPADVWRMPINFPVEPAKGWSFPGMLTPALDSAYGECSFWTTSPERALEVDYTKLEQVTERNGVIRLRLKGPAHLYKVDDHEHPEQTAAPIKVYVDYDHGTAAIDTGARRLVLQPGQWSTFVPVEFPMLPMGMESVSGIVRFYLRSIEPEFELYCSPVNVDPLAPLNPVSEPADASAELAEEIGLYYTQGMAEDVSALKKKVLTDQEFMQQVELVYTERQRMLDYALERFMEKEDGGLLFFYFSTVDLASHMMWRHTDRAHPAHDAELAQEDSSWWSGRDGSTWLDTVHDLYIKMDPVVGRIQEAIGEDAILVLMSDHGFAPYRRKFGLNTWLLENGYLVLRDGYDRELPASSPEHRAVNIFDLRQGEDGELHSIVDWSKTRAYGMGFNGLYLNLAGRELDNPDTPGDESGIVQPGADADTLLAEIKVKLEALTDPDTGLKPVLRCDLATEIYEGERLAEAPDLLVGYNAGYGNSDPASTGRITSYVLEDNTGGTFNGSHLMAPEVVSGILVSNRPVRDGNHKLEDLTVEVLELFGVEPSETQKGHRVLQTGP
ncbi:MAG: alkaline phosphatase family protein [Planctomycetota bacterium]